MLKNERTGLQIREDKKKGVYVDGLSEWAVRTPNEIYSLIKKGALSRNTASTNMNDVSSRSHAVFIITIEQMLPVSLETLAKGKTSAKVKRELDKNIGDAPNAIKVSKLNLVDLAGSERIRITGAKGKRLEECKKINQSLSAIGNVISALTEGKNGRVHIPYRDSKLTRLLEDSLGGNCKTTFMAMISPAVDAFNESLSTLKFAHRAKAVKNVAVINEDEDQKAVLRRYEIELMKLREELEMKNRNLVDKGRLIQLEEEKRKAEQDKKAAMLALEARSKEFFNEREEKRKLEEQIMLMRGQLVYPGQQPDFKAQCYNSNTPECMVGISSRDNQERNWNRKNYEKRIEDLEAERIRLVDSQAQVDRYKSLLQKQRDIMIALTTRLNERDEAIGQLQEELDAYDKIHKEAEIGMEFYKKRVSSLENELKRRNIAVPLDNFNFQATADLTNQDERVKFHDIETFNINYQNLSFAQAKVEELKEIAQERERKIEQLVSEIQEREQIEETKDCDFQMLLKENEKLRQRASEYQRTVKTLKENVVPNNENSMVNNEYVISSVDEIVSNLSKQNDPKTLQNVARQLLRLQKYVHSAHAKTGENQQIKNENEGTQEFGISKYIIGNNKNSGQK